MAPKIRDYTPLLMEVIAEARAAGLETAANDLERAASAVYTTSTEMLVEHGMALRTFLRATRRTLPPATRAKAKACLNETELVFPGWRQLRALLRRPRTLG